MSKRDSEGFLFGKTGLLPGSAPTVEQHSEWDAYFEDLFDALKKERGWTEILQSDRREWGFIRIIMNEAKSNLLRVLNEQGAYTDIHRQLVEECITESFRAGYKLAVLFARHGGCERAAAVGSSLIDRPSKSMTAAANRARGGKSKGERCQEAERLFREILEHAPQETDAAIRKKVAAEMGIRLSTLRTDYLQAKRAKEIRKQAFDPED